MEDEAVGADNRVLAVTGENGQEAGIARATRTRGRTPEDDEEMVELREKYPRVRDDAELRNKKRLSDITRMVRRQKENGIAKSSPDFRSIAKLAEESGYMSSWPAQDVQRHIGVQERRERKAVAEVPVVQDVVDISDDAIFERTDTPPSSGRPGNSGSRKKTEQETANARLRRVGMKGFESFEAYRDAFAQATLDIAALPEGKKLTGARQIVRDKFTFEGEAQVSPGWLCRCARVAPGVAPERQGGTIFTFAEERILAELIRKERRAENFCPRRLIIQRANELFGLVVNDGGRQTQPVGAGGITEGWYEGFVTRHALGKGHSKAIDTTRSDWLTSENARVHYDVLFDVCKKQGIFASEREWFAEDDDETRDTAPGSEQSGGGDEGTWLHPERLVSADEIGLPLGFTIGKGTKNKTTTAGEGDEGRVKLPTHTPNNSLLFVRSGDCKALPPIVVFGGHNDVKSDWTTDALDLKDGDAVIPAVWRANTKGSVTADLFHEHFEKVVLPYLKHVGVTNEPGCGGVYVVDGCQTHCSEEISATAEAANIAVVLRPPHTSSDMQGEDTKIFGALRGDFESFVLTAQAEINRNAAAGGTPEKLNLEVFKDVITQCYEVSTMEERITSAWRADGVIPATRLVQHLLAEREDDDDPPSVARTLEEKFDRVIGAAARFPTMSTPDGHRIKVPKQSLKASRELAQVTDALADTREAEALVNRIDQGDQPLTRESHDEMKLMLKNLIAKVKDCHAATIDWAVTHSTKPRASDLWYLRGGLWGDDAKHRFGVYQQRLTNENTRHGLRHDPDRVFRLSTDRLQECERAFGAMRDRIQGDPYLTNFNVKDLMVIYGVATNKRPRQGDRKQAIKDECLEYLSVHHPEFYPDSDQELPGRPVNASGAADENDDEDDEDDDVPSDEEN